MFRQIRKRLPPWGTCRNFLIGGSILVGLHALSRYNDLLFHSFAGIVGVLMVWAVLRHWKHADEALQQQRQFLETVIDSVQDGILACDAGGNLIFHNRAFRKLHRLPPGLTVAEAGQALPDTLYRSLYRSDGRTPLGKEDAPLDRVLRGEQVDNFELVVVPLGGPPTTVLVSGRPLVGQHDENLGGVVAIRDITARKRAEEMLRDRERHQALLLKRLEGINRLQEELLLPGPIEEKFKKITDAAVTLLDLDFCRVWRVKPGDLCKGGCLHAEAQDEIHACRRRDKCLHLLASSGRYTSIDGTHRRVPLGCNKIGRVATGKSKRFLTNSVGTDPQVADHQWAISLGLVSFAGYKLRAARNDATGVLAAFARHTISEEDNAFLAQLAETTSKIILDSQVQDELRQSQKLEAVGSLAGGIAHEFNNLLQAIGGYAHCAMEGLPCGEQRYGDLQQVVKAADRAAVLTRQLLGFSRRSVAQCKHLDPNAAVADLAKLVRPLIGADVDLETILGAELGTVYADPAGLQQVLLNLSCCRRIAWFWARRSGSMNSRSAPAPTWCSALPTRAAACRPRCGGGSSSPSSQPRKWAKEPAWGCQWSTASCGSTKASSTFTASRSGAPRFGSTCRSPATPNRPPTPPGGRPFPAVTRRSCWRKTSRWCRASPSVCCRERAIRSWPLPTANRQFACSRNTRGKSPC
jgi:PAS domain-containing protein